MTLQKRREENRDGLLKGEKFWELELLDPKGKDTEKEEPVSEHMVNDLGRKSRVYVSETQ
jgi:hypothetical protein